MIIFNKYIFHYNTIWYNNDGVDFMKYLISETTEEERRLIAQKALAISLTGAEPPSEDVLDLVNDYIEGRKELSEIQELVINKYKHKEDD